MIAYTKGYKYQLAEPYKAKTGITGFSASAKWIELYEDGTLLLDTGFAWDGSSGPTWDNNKDKQPSAEHDAFCRLIRFGLLPESLKDAVDQRYHDKCIEDGMWKIKAGWRLKALQKVSSYIKPSSRKKIYYAP